MNEERARTHKIQMGDLVFSPEEFLTNNQNVRKTTLEEAAKYCGDYALLVDTEQAIDTAHALRNGLRGLIDKPVTVIALKKQQLKNIIDLVMIVAGDVDEHEQMYEILRPLIELCE